MSFYVYLCPDHLQDLPAKFSYTGNGMKGVSVSMKISGIQRGSLSCVWLIKTEFTTTRFT